MSYNQTARPMVTRTPAHHNSVIATPFLTGVAIPAADTSFECHLPLDEEFVPLVRPVEHTRLCDEYRAGIILDDVNQ
jgi:hypothetical protein